MKKFGQVAAFVSLLFALPAAGQSITGLFKSSGDRVLAKSAHLSFPKAIGGLAITGTDEFSHKGQLLDNGIQYRAPNGIWATVYIYLPGYPDAGLAAYQTDHILPQVYGIATMRTSQGVMPFVGQAAAAIRMTYAGAQRDGQELATASAFARVGGWIVKIRVSGPAALQQDVEATLDALVGSVRLDGKARVFPVGVPSFAPPCPAGTSGKVGVAGGDDAMAGTMIAAISMMPMNDVPKAGTDPIPPAFPANGLTRLCVRGTVKAGTDRFAVFQPAGTDKPDAIVVVLGDNGDLIAITKDLGGGNYTIAKAEIGKLTVAGAIDRMPDNDDLQRLFDGAVPEALKVRATITFKADGNSNIALDTPPAKK